MVIIQWIMAHAVTLLAVLGATRLLAAGIAKLTPTKSDDEIVARIENLLDRLGSMFLVPKTDSLKLIDATKTQKEVNKAQDLKAAGVAADVKEALAYAKTRNELLPEAGAMSSDLHKALMALEE